MGEMQILTTADQVFEALGGSSGVAEITGAKPSAVSNWKAFGRFPPSMYGLMIDALEERGHSAPRSLWRMKERVGEHS